MSHGHSDNPNLGHHWENMPQQYGAAKLGMWVFLAQEILFFSGLFCAYAVLRYNYPDVFHYGYKLLDKNYGAVNTVILLISSFTMAMAVRASQIGNQKQLKLMLALTFIGGCGFMVIKGIEYEAKFHKGALWGVRGYDRSGAENNDQLGGFDYVAAMDRAHVTTEDLDKAGAPGSDPTRVVGTTVNPPSTPPLLAVGGRDAGLTGNRSTLSIDNRAVNVEENKYGIKGPPPPGLHRFYGIYFFLTGLHGLHVVIGMGLMAWLYFTAGRYGPKYFTPVDMVGLYWHLVDLIWIFLFPLLYLVE